MHIAIITAGGAGMFCGSCMHDNTWAKALMAQGCEVSLIPTYTPIRVDETDASLDRVFFGGINVYLSGKYGWWNRIPKFMTKWLDHPAVIRRATAGAVSNDAHDLGSLTLSMLEGEHGPHLAAIDELANFLAKDLKPDVVIFSNALLAGAVARIKESFTGPVICILQGDDVFLDALIPQYRDPVMKLLSEKAPQFDGFLTHSEFYRDYMANYIGLSVDQFRVIPLGINLDGHDGTPQSESARPLTIGYFARMAPEKGLHHLTEAFAILKKQLPDAKLKLGGFMPAQHQDYFNGALAPLNAYQSDIDHIGSPATFAEKVEFYKSVDVLSVPTEFLEPKGIYVLEAMANGVPVVQPAHGAFPEVIARTGGGILTSPRTPRDLATALERLNDPVERHSLSQSAWTNVREHYNLETMAKKTIEHLEEWLSNSKR